MSPQPNLHWFNSKLFQLPIKVVELFEIMHLSQQKSVHIFTED